MDQVKVPRELLRQVLDALEFFASEMTVGQRCTNEGQTVIDAPMQLRTALEQKTSPSDECLSQPAVEPERYVWMQYADHGNGIGWFEHKAVGYDPRHPDYAERYVGVVWDDEKQVRSFRALYTAPQASESVLTNASAQQPRKAVKLSINELHGILSSNNWQDDQWDYERAVEQAVWAKLGVTE